MMEHTTDRLFWTLSAIIVAALLLTLSVKAFPKATQQAIAPMTGLMKQADKATSGININVGSIESGDNNNGNTTDTSNNDNSNNMGSVTNSTGPDDGLIGQVQQQNDQSTRANMSLANYQVQLNTATSQISSLQQQLQAIQNNPNNSSVSAQAITDLSSRLQALSQTVSNNQDATQSQINQVMQSSNDKTSAIQSILQTLQNNQSGNTNDINNLNNLLNQANTQLGYTVQYQSFILPNNDLNTVTKQGIYSIAGTYPNINGSIYGRLVVYNDTRNNQQNIERVIYTNQGDIYINSTDWWGNTPFKRILNEDDLQSVMSKGRTLDGNDDIDQITAPGIYLVNGSNPPKNSPNNYGNWSVLTVGTTQAGARMDTWTDWQGNVYTRYFDMNEHPWFRTLTTNDLNDINSQLNQIKTQIQVLQTNTVQYQPAPADGTSLRNITKPGIYVLNGPSSEEPTFSAQLAQSGRTNHHWTDWPTTESNDSSRSWYHILIVTGGQASPTDKDVMNQFGQPNVTHQKLITGGYSWDPAISYERTFHTGSKDSDYVWNQDGTNNADIQAKQNDDIARQNAPIASQIGLVFINNGNGTADISSYDGSQTDITIPAYIKDNNGTLLKVTGISAHNYGNTRSYFGAFNGAGRTKLNSVTIPNTVTVIGNWAFAGNNLTSITLPNNLTYLGSSAFALNNIQTVNIPSSLTTSPNQSFDSNVNIITTNS